MILPRFVIFDLDNTLYKEPPALSRACEEAMARAAADLIPGLSFEEALVKARESNDATGSVFSFFPTYFSEQRAGGAYDHAVIHETYHNYVDHLILPVCENTKEAFAKIDKDQVALGLLTHGSRGWTNRVLTHLGLDEYFLPGLRVPIEDVDFHHKHESERPFHEIMKRASEHLGGSVSAPQCMMVEDVPRNLSVARQLGMRTVLVTHGVQGQVQEDADFHVSSVGELIDNFLA